MKTVFHLQAILAVGRLLSSSSGGAETVWIALKEKLQLGHILGPEWATRTNPEIHAELYARWTRGALTGGWHQQLEDALAASPREWLRYLTFLRAPDSSCEERLDRLLRMESCVSERLAKSLSQPFFEILQGMRADGFSSSKSKDDGLPCPTITIPAHEIFTRSQSLAVERITSMAHLYFSRSDSLGLRPRFSPLLVGPTGSGKTEIVTRAAKRAGAHLVRVSVGEWVPVGARDAKPTLQIVTDALINHSRVTVFIDELDKLAQGDGAWIRSSLCEIYDLLERSLPAELVKKHVDPELVIERAKKNLWLVGAGAWQHLHARREAGPLGFGSALKATAISTEGLIAKALAEGFPAELLGRFHGLPIFLSYPDAHETMDLLNKFGLIDLAERVGRKDLIESFSWSPFGLRKLETLYADLLLAGTSPASESADGPDICVAPITA